MEKSSTKTQIFQIGISFIAALFLNIFLAKDEWLMLLKQNSHLHPERLPVIQKNVRPFIQYFHYKFKIITKLIF
jgi:hypothetical protein